MKTTHLTDDELQAYIDKPSAYAIFDLHLKDCQACKVKIENYQLIKNALKVNEIVPSLSIDLAAAVGSKIIPQKKIRAFSPELFLYGSAVLFILAALIYTGKLIGELTLGPVLVLIIPIILYVML